MGVTLLVSPNHTENYQYVVRLIDQTVCTKKYTVLPKKKKKGDINKKLGIQINNYLRHRSQKSSCNEATYR